VNDVTDDRAEPSLGFTADPESGDMTAYGGLELNFDVLRRWLRVGVVQAL
jgi:hypothetical protein